MLFLFTISLVSLVYGSIVPVKCNLAMLFQSIEQGNRPLLLDCVRQRVHLSADVSGWNALMFAIEKKSDLAIDLIHFGSDLNLKDTDGYTPLLVSIENGFDRVTDLLIYNGADLLIYNGADLNAQNVHGLSPLMDSIICNNTRVAELLIHEGADLDLRDALGETALMLSVLESNLEISRMLLLHGADFRVVSLNGETALSLATLYGSEGAVHLLEKAANTVE